MSLKVFLDQPTHSSYINGKFSEEKRNNHTLISPITKSKWKTIYQANKQETLQAIEAAQKISNTWKFTPPPLRGKLLRLCGDLLIQNKEVIAETIAYEMGKPLKEGIQEVVYSAGFFHWFAGEAERIYGMTVPSQYVEKRIMILMEPIGVSGLITPWNFPLSMPARKIAAALAAGCPVILKPSKETPLTALAIAFIFNQINLQPGVFNVVIGPEQEIGEALLESPIVRKISFTGSCEVGKYLYEKSAPTLKKLTMELGGHAPVVILDDANLDRAIEGTLTAKFRNNGQTCVSVNRILVQEKIYPSFLTKFTEKVKSLKIGNPLDPNTDISVILHPSATKKVKEHTQDALEKGNEAYEPTILDKVTPNMTIFNEETFGPVAPIITFKTLEEGIALANHSKYGLASYLFTESMSQGHIAIGTLDYGIIGLNDGLPSTPQGSFGGVKFSGFGREGGPSGVKEYLVEKYVSIGL